MSVICFGGFCIPYSVLWPFVLIIFKPLWDIFSKWFGWDKAKDPVTTKSCCGQNSSKESSVGTEGITATKSETGVYHIETDDQFEALRNSDVPSIVKFTASWCKPCQKIKPKFDDLAVVHAESASFMVVDVDKFDSIAAEHGAVRIPLFVAFHSGKTISSINTDDADKLHAFVSENVVNPK